MPTYTYECKKCGHAFDVFHGMSATPKVKCEECNGACKKRLGIGSGIIFKGSGFYETDYKNKGGSGSKSEKSESSSESKSEPKTDSKSESKSDSKPSESKGGSSSEKKSSDSKAKSA